MPIVARFHRHNQAGCLAAITRAIPYEWPAQERNGAWISTRRSFSGVVLGSLQ